MGHVSHKAIGNAPVEFAFGYVDDYRNVPKWMFGVSEFTPVGEQDQGLGAKFDTAIKLGPTTLHVRIDITEWEQDRLIALRTIKGIKATSSWRFAPHGDNQTEINAAIDYQLPGGFAGRALGKVIDAFVAPAVRHVDKHLRARIEESYVDSVGGSK